MILKVSPKRGQGELRDLSEFTSEVILNERR